MMTAHLAIYLFLAFASFINIIVPLSGTATVTPFLAALTDAHTGIALAAFYFLMSGVIRITVFRREIQWRFIRKLLPISAVGAAIGALSLVAVPDGVLLGILVVFTIYFIYKKLARPRQPVATSPTSVWGGHVIGLFSGFLQGTGLAGSDLRNNYLYSENLTLVQVHGTSASIGAMNFAIATAIRLALHKVSIPDITSLLVIFPFVLVGTLAGRHVMARTKKSHENWIVVFVMLMGLVLVLWKLFRG